MALVARRLATSTELLAIPEEQRFHEVIDGEIIQKANPTSKPLHDLGAKFDAYQRNAVPHYWIIDPMSERLRGHRWTSEGYLVVLNAGRGQRVRAEPFEAIELFVGELFGDEPDQDEPGG